MAEFEQEPTLNEDVPAVEETAIVIPANRPRKVYDGMWGPAVERVSSR